jgi:hypothetical protein
MYIIDRNRDFYDHFSHIYGVDKNIIFDRRGSEILTDSRLAWIAGHPYARRDTYFILLEAGNTQYVMRVADIQEGAYCDFKSFTLSLERTFAENRNFFGSPLSIHRVDGRRAWAAEYRKLLRKNYIPQSIEEVIRLVEKDHTSVYLPILKNTSLTKFLDPFELWKAINTYISSLGNDKDVSLHMSEEDKAAIHGFDRHSFRHPTK